MSEPISVKRAWSSKAAVVQWLAILASIVFVVWILASRQDELRAAFSLTPSLFALISVSAIATFLVNGIELQVLAGRFGSRVPFKEALLLGLMVSTLNYLPMKMGTVLNGVLMKQRYKVSLSHFGALVIGSSFIHLWVALAAAGSAMVFIAPDTLWPWLFLAAPTLFILALVAWGTRRTHGRYEAHDSRVIRIAMRAVDGLGIIYSSRRLLLIEVVINFVLVMLAVSRTMWAFKALSVDAGFGASIVVTALGITAARLSVIPGGLGLKEAGAALGSSMTGIPADLGFAASVIERAVTLVWLVLLGVPATIHLQRLGAGGAQAGPATDGSDATGLDEVSGT